jgi:hypothetical protein
MRSEILTAANAKITFFWDMMTCSLTESYQHAPFYCEDGGSRYSQNTDNFQSHYMT